VADVLVQQRLCHQVVVVAVAYIEVFTKDEQQGVYLRDQDEKQGSLPGGGGTAATCEVTQRPEALDTSRATFIPGLGKVRCIAVAAVPLISPQVKSCTMVPALLEAPEIERQHGAPPAQSLGYLRMSSRDSLVQYLIVQYLRNQQQGSPSVSCTVRAERTTPSSTVHTWFGSAVLQGAATALPLAFGVAPREVRHRPPSNLIGPAPPGVTCSRYTGEHVNDSRYIGSMAIWAAAGVTCSSCSAGALAEPHFSIATRNPVAGASNAVASAPS